MFVFDDGKMADRSEKQILLPTNQTMAKKKMKKVNRMGEMPPTQVRHRIATQILACHSKLYVFCYFTVISTAVTYVVHK